MINIALLEVDQPAIAAEGPTEADVSAIPAPGAVIAVEGDQSVALATVEPPQTIAAVEGAQLLDVAMVEDDPAMTTVGAPSNVMVVVNFSEGLGGGSQARETFSGSTTSVAHLDTVNFELDAYPTYALLEILLSHPCRIRIYTDNTSRSNDAGRSIGTDPNPGSGLIAEVVSIVADYRQIITPFVVGGNLDDPPSGMIYMSVTNQSGSTRPITVSLTLLQLEE